MDTAFLWYINVHVLLVETMWRKEWDLFRLEIVALSAQVHYNAFTATLKKMANCADVSSEACLNEIKDKIK